MDTLVKHVVVGLLIAGAVVSVVTLAVGGVEFFFISTVGSFL